jgi:hypothetical protein
MKLTGRLALSSFLLLAAACGGGGSSDTGTMFIESCVLGCSSGVGGRQVSCGVVNTFQNQEIALLFSESVDFSSVDKATFNITDVNSGSTPVGNFVADAENSRRVIFRPELTFDEQGNPVFGFKPGASYRIFIPGRAQDTNTTYIQSTGGQANNSRLLCTITTDQGISDPVPGPPVVRATVTTVDPVTGNVTDPAAPAAGATNVSLTSPIVLEFDDLMNVGTLVVVDPITGNLVAPFIKVKVDPDGNIGDPTDQIELQGEYTYLLDQVALRTFVVYRPLQPYPNAGSNALSPRKILIELPEDLRDLSGNSLKNAGILAFTPLSLTFNEILIPPGGEQFNKALANNEDPARTGADWGDTTPGRLLPGQGGGSGRLGDLRVLPGETVTFITGAVHAEGTLTYSATPDSGDSITWGGPPGTLMNFFDGGFGTIEIDAPHTSLTLAYLVNWLNVTQATNPNINTNNYYLENGNTVRIVAKTPGVVGNNYNFVYSPATPSNPAAVQSGPTLSGGKDEETFAPGNLVDNTPAGGTPAAIEISNGVFEFATVDVQNGGTLQFMGPNAARLFVRGRLNVQGLIDVSGDGPGGQPSGQPFGQPPTLARGGPNAGGGGQGGDRPNNFLGANPNQLWAPDPDTIPLSQGIRNDDNPVLIGGQAGVGVAASGTLAAGPGGTHWPNLFPTTKKFFGEMNTNANCVSEQVGGAGGGGGYALDGGAGVAMAVNATSSQGNSNTPPDTPGGDASVLGIEPPGVPPIVRKLTPELGFLRGGAGGGGGGAHVKDTATNGLPGQCLAASATILTTTAVPYRSHSGGAGGGGGGAIQIQAGRSAQVSGIIDASGGDGGSALTSGAANDSESSPGGGGSGGAVLFQSKNIILAAAPGRVSIAGGAGGLGVSGSLGGDGSPGLARIESIPAPNPVQVALSLDPIDPGDPTSAKWLSVGQMAAQRQLPGSFSGAQSCWQRPAGGFFGLVFTDDLPGDPGWDVDLILDLGAGPVTLPYRAPNGVMLQTFEEFWGQLIDRDLMVGEMGAPFAVRFQGAKLVGSLPTPPTECSEVPLSGPLSPILEGSLTPWVRHPAELNNFAVTPDMVRFLVLFDASKTEFKKIVGVTNLRIRATPD